SGAKAKRVFGSERSNAGNGGDWNRHAKKLSAKKFPDPREYHEGADRGRALHDVARRQSAIDQDDYVSAQADRCCPGSSRSCRRDQRIRSAAVPVYRGAQKHATFVSHAKSPVGGPECRESRRRHSCAQARRERFFHSASDTLSRVSQKSFHSGDKMKGEI